MGILKVKELQSSNGDTVLDINDDGTININDIKDAIRIDDVHFPKTSLICIENTHNKCYGFPLELSYINLVCDTAHENNINVHMDGARMFNACVALDVDAKKVLENVDSVTFCLSKGLSSPIGSVLCGTKDFIKEVKTACLWKKKSSTFEPDFCPVRLDSDPWIVQPTEHYEELSIEELIKRN